MVLSFTHRRIFGNLALIKEKFSFYLLLFIVCFQLRLIVTSELKVLAINFCKKKLICVRINNNKMFRPLFIFPPFPYTVGGVNICLNTFVLTFDFLFLVNTDQYLIKSTSALIDFVLIVLFIFPTRTCRRFPQQFSYPN